MTVFGRRGSHKYDSSIAVLLKSDESRAAVACNLMFDHRVTLSREEDFDAYIDESFPEDNSRIENAIKDYFEFRVRRAKDPAFLDHRSNGINFVSGHPEESRELVLESRPLVRLLDLTGLSRVYEWAQRKKENLTYLAREFPYFDVEQFEEFPGVSSENEINAWIDEALRADRDRFVGSTLVACNEHRKRHRFHPSWVTYWHRFEDYLRESSPMQCLRRLGMFRASDRWVIALRYTVAEAGSLLRPTMLDSGWNCWHFPSPPQMPLDGHGSSRYLGGHPMDLAGSSNSVDLIPEFIHEQIDHVLDQWKAANAFCDLAEFTESAPHLNDIRLRHHTALKNLYAGVVIEKWMPHSLSRI